MVALQDCCRPEEPTEDRVGLFLRVEELIG
jgi:hypothetical protein